MQRIEHLQGSPRRIFCAYSQDDELTRKLLDEHLSPLKRANLVDVWNDHMILPGAQRHAAIQQELDAADIVLLLLSASFIGCDFCYFDQLKRAVDRHRAGTAIVIPILVRTCAWRHTLVGELQPLPSDSRAINEWPDKDMACYNVVEGITAALQRSSTHGRTE